MIIPAQASAVGLVEIYFGDATTTKVLKDWTDKFEAAPSSPHDILFKNATWVHAGIYQCTVIDKDNNQKNKTAFVTVVGK